VRRRLLPLILIVTLLLLLLPAAAQAISFDQAVDKLIRDGYPQRLERKLTSFKSIPMGFRWAGSEADNQAARFLAAEMRRIGMTGVSLEAVPVDEWTPIDQYVLVDGKKLRGSPYPGVPPTPMGGLTGQVVYVDDGQAVDFFGLDVEDKIVIVDFNSVNWWFNFPAAEAGLRGAKAVILTFSPTYPGYQGQPGAFASNDPGYSMDYPPIMWLRQTDADWLKAKIAAEPATEATFVLRSKHQMATAGGVGYNVVGSVRGKAQSRELIVLGSHHDAHFTGAMDNSAAAVMSLTMVKAMKMSGYRPNRTITILSTTAEEWGYTNCNYDWLVGSVHAASVTHTGWAGRIAAFLEIEIPAYKDGVLWFTATHEMAPWLEAMIEKYKPLTSSPSGEDAYVITPDSDDGLWFSYNDQWPFSVMGAPSVCSWTPDAAFWESKYHTQFDNYAAIDWQFFGRETKFHWRLAREMDAQRSVLPYDLGVQALKVDDGFDGDALVADGLDEERVRGFEDALSLFQTAAATFERTKGLVPAANASNVNHVLLDVVKDFNSNFLALSIWDFTYFPWTQGQTDLEYLAASLAALEPGAENADEALLNLDNVCLTWYGTNFSYPVYKSNLVMRRPSYYRANMAAIGHMPLIIDVMPQYADIQSGDYETARTALSRKAVRVTSDLEDRLAHLEGVLRTMADKVESVTPMGPVVGR